MGFFAWLTFLGLIGLDGIQWMPQSIEAETWVAGSWGLANIFLDGPSFFVPFLLFVKYDFVPEKAFGKY